MAEFTLLVEIAQKLDKLDAHMNKMDQRLDHMERQLGVSYPFPFATDKYGKILSVGDTCRFHRFLFTVQELGEEDAVLTTTNQDGEVVTIDVKCRDVVKI